MSIIEEVINRAIATIQRQREELVIGALKEEGYVFETREELKSFIRLRCTIIGFTYNNEKILKVDDKMICRWNEDVKFEIEGNNIKITSG